MDSGDKEELDLLGEQGLDDIGLDPGVARIKSETAARVLGCVGELGYAVNLKARGLRLSRSGLVGMIVPHYRNRFFAGLAEAFEAEARSRRAWQPGAAPASSMR